MFHKHTIYWKFPDRYLYLWVYLSFDKGIFTGYDKQTSSDYRWLFEVSHCPHFGYYFEPMR